MAHPELNDLKGPRLPSDLIEVSSDFTYGSRKSPRLLHKRVHPRGIDSQWMENSRWPPEGPTTDELASHPD
jgi:hypothetical protein